MRKALLFLALVACSQPAKLGTSKQAIVGGEVDQATNAVVALRIESGEKATRCTGTIVKAGLILTAAHCFDPTPTRVTILTGPNVENPTSTFFGTSFETYAAKFDEFYDLAMVSFAENATSIAPMPLMAPADYSKLTASTSQFLAVGYGKTEPDGGTITERRHITLTFDELRRSRIATSSPAGSTCFGDSGGALINTAGRLAGVHSGVTDCGPGQTNVAIGFYPPEVSAWLRSFGLDVPPSTQPNGAECVVDNDCTSGACVNFRIGDAGTRNLCTVPDEDDTPIPTSDAAANQSPAPDAATSPNAPAPSSSSDDGCAMRPESPTRGLTPLLIILLVPLFRSCRARLRREASKRRR